MTYTINCNSRMSKGMKLNGNILSGDTYGAKQYIKEHWDGKWNASSKTWTVDPSKVISTIEKQQWGFSKVLSISTDTTVSTETNHSHNHKNNGICPICGTYCYGDCQAN